MLKVAIYLSINLPLYIYIYVSPSVHLHLGQSSLSLQKSYAKGLGLPYVVLMASWVSGVINFPRPASMMKSRIHFTRTTLI